MENSGKIGQNREKRLKKENEGRKEGSENADMNWMRSEREGEREVDIKQMGPRGHILITR